MLFNSPEFIFGYLPITFITFFVIARRDHGVAALWLGIASLVFYGWWSIEAVPLLLASITCNYLFGHKVSPRDSVSDKRRRLYLTGAIGANLMVLGYFKYADFFIGSLHSLVAGSSGEPAPLLNIVLPIGISFYTFTQIAYLVDSWQGKVLERKFSHYLLFVTYFPHLIAGPILHHAQMMPQFRNSATYRPNLGLIYAGLSIFMIGLAKKLVVADSLADFANAFFGAAQGGAEITLIDGWAGALAYTLQLYFDFSGYSDMAIGLSLLFGIKLPINFDAPYKATSIIDFWRRWHISLSTFLRDYLYIPLGGNRFGEFRRYINLFTTMLLGGLWHGAAWTFVLWGAAHGLFLTINHLWRKLAGPHRFSGPFGAAAAWALTFSAVVFAWVLFRAESLGSAAAIYRGMLGMNGLVLPEQLANIAPAASGFIRVVGTMPALGEGTIMGTLEQITLVLLGLAIAVFGVQARHMSDRLRLLTIGLTAGFVVNGLFFAHAKQFLYFQF